MSTPAEQIAEFVRLHPGEWREEPTENPDEMAFVLEVYPYRIKVEAYLSAVWGSLEHVNYDDTPQHGPHGGDIFTQIAHRGADAIQAHGGTVADLPAWLQDETRRVLRHRAGELLTAAGFSPADVVSAAETVDEALCARAPVAPTYDGVVNALMAIGMSCRWIGGDPLILIGDFVYLRADLKGASIDVFAAFTEKHGQRRMVKGDKSGAPAVPGYRVFMALAPLPHDPEEEPA